MPGRTKYALYVYDIPVDILQQICTTLDNDKGWKYLAGKCGYNQDKVTSFNLEYYRPHGSPTERLILDWGVRNPTIRDLYEKLRTIDRIREMKLLEPLLQASKEYEQQERAQREAEEREAKAREEEAKEKEARAQAAAAAVAAKEDLKGADNYDEKSGKSKLVSAQPLTVDGYLTASNGKREDASNLPAESQGNYEALNQLDREKNNLYEQLNLDKTAQKGKSKASQKKELGIELDATRQVDRKMISPVVNQSKLESSPVNTYCNASPPQSSSSKEIDFQMSEDDLASAKSLSFDPAGTLAKDTVVAVSATARFTYKDLSRATNGFADGNKIGEGSFGDVYLGVLKESKCAVKRLRQTEMWRASKELMERHVSEIKTLMIYRNENILQLYGFAVDGDEICLVYQYMENGSLEDRLQCKDDTQPLTWSQRMNILLGAARGVQYLHTMNENQPLIHGDIKSANILLDKHFEARISDFGLAEYANAGQQTGIFTHVSKKEVDQNVYGTRAYLPPEFFSNGPSTKSDIYGFGVIILETCTGEKAYDEKRESEIFLSHYASTVMEDQPQETWPNSLGDSRAGPPPTLINYLLELAKKCISERKKNRPTMKDALEQLKWIESRCLEDITYTGLVSFGDSGQIGGVPSQLTDQPIHTHRNSKLGRPSLPRMSSLPNQPPVPRQVAKVMVKSHSLDEIPEPIRLQQMYDEQQYQQKLKLLGETVFAGEPGSGEPVDGGGPTIEDSDVCNSLDSNDTLTEERVSEIEDNLRFYGDEVPEPCEDGSDPAKLKAMQEFDGAQKNSVDVCCDTSVEEKLEQLEVSEPPPAPDPLHECGELPLHGELSEYAAGNSCPDTDLNSDSINKMESFISMYEAEVARMNCDQTAQAEGDTAQSEPVEGPDLEHNQQQLDMKNMVYCGLSVFEGQQMAVLMDPSTNQHYAVDPSMIDASLYHHQQLSYYMQCQNDMGQQSSDMSQC